MAFLKKRFKIILIIVASLLLLITIAGTWVATHYKSVIKKELPAQIAKATDSLYTITFDKVSINLLSRSISLRNAHIQVNNAVLNKLKADSSAPNNYFDVKIPKVKVKGIMWDEAVGGNGYSANDFIISKADVSIFKLPKYLSVNDTTKRKQNKTQLSISSLIIERSNAKYYPKIERDSSAIHFKNIRIALNNWNTNSTGSDTARFLMAEEGTLQADSILYNIPGTDYTFISERNRYNSYRNRFTAKNTQIKLNISNDEFFKKAPVQTEIYDLHFPTVEMDDIDWHTLINDKELRMSTVYFNHMKVNVLFNRLLPENTKSKMGNYPNQLLQKLKLPLYIEKVYLNSCDITYTEISHRTGKKGSINFSNANGTVKNITNIKSLTDSNNQCIARLDGKFNKYSDISAVFNFTLDDPKGTFSVNTELRNLQGHQINQQSKVFTLIAIKSLNMKKMTMELVGNEDYAESKFVMLYNNMSIQILKDEADENGDKKKKGFLTFIANNMLLYSNNPMPGKETRTIDTYLKRTKEKSFFNLIWKNIHQGVQNTCIRNLSIIDWMKKNEEKALDKRNKGAKKVFVPNK